ncbi:MAG TPA: ABC transporter permease [Candidatus Angelobacter sp.]|jgi:ABC-2 type transport system permease protein|nr:ABC transporter permease [Candidatus Angelobacter sp.]
MKQYLAIIAMDIKLALRLRAVIFFNFLFPLIFFFTFATVLRGEPGAMTFVVTMSVTLGVLGSGFFGAGIRAIQEREMNILRRYRVTPITPAPLLVGSMVTGWVIFLPYIVLLLLMAHFLYHMPLPSHFFQLLLFISLGLIAFRSLGLVIASVANTMQEGTILVQLFYFPMLLLSGATFPAEKFPRVMRIIHNFVPATYLVQGMQNIMVKGQGLMEKQNLAAAGVMVLTIVGGMLISMKLFRWEKEEKIRGSAKLWVFAVLAPFFAMGIWKWFQT